jgi:hypothetical protein
MKSIFLCLAIVLCAGSSFAQDSLSHRAVYPGGIAVEYGLGRYSVRDEYISKEKYSGTLPAFGLAWSRFHKTYGYSLGLEYRHSSEIENYNVSTDIHQFSLHQGLLYPLTKGSLFNRDVYLFLGPAAELYFFYNEQNIAVSGFDYAQSFAMLFSLGVNSEIIMPLRKNLQAEGAVRVGLLSLGFRMVDTEEEDISPVKPLTVFSGTNGSVRLGMRYYVVGNFSVKLAYQLQVTRISSWDPLLSASDNVIVTAAYRF